MIKGRNKTRLRYPSLWKGCVGAWAPCLGPTGLTLRDWSGYGNHGTLTNGPTFSPQSGRNALNFDGSNDYVDCGTSALHQFSTSNDFSVSCWFLATSTTTEKGLVMRMDSGDQGWGLTISSGFVRFPRYSSGPRFAISTNTVYAVTAVNRAGTQEIWVDGILRESAATGLIQSNSINMVIGRYYGNYAGFVHAGWIDATSAHSRALTPNEIRLLALRRGIAYEMAPDYSLDAYSVPSSNSAANMLLGTYL